MDMIFSLRQLQEKCREQQKPLFIAFIDLTKAFDMVSRSGLFSILRKIGSLPDYSASSAFITTCTVQSSLMALPLIPSR